MAFRGGEELARLLTVKGVAGRASVWRGGPCDMVVFESGGELYALTYREGVLGWVYVKVYPASASISLMSCDEVLYSPWGLYVYGKNLEDLVEGIRRKLPRLARMGEAGVVQV